MKKSFQFLLVGSGIVLGALLLIMKQKRGR